MIYKMSKPIQRKKEDIAVSWYQEYIRSYSRLYGLDLESRQFGNNEDQPSGQSSLLDNYYQWILKARR
jgi:hypothetical protein